MRKEVGENPHKASLESGSHEEHIMFTMAVKEMKNQYMTVCNCACPVVVFVFLLSTY